MTTRRAKKKNTLIDVNDNEASGARKVVGSA